MALYIETTESKKTIKWHTGGKSLKDAVGDSAFVVSVQADGDELDMIIRKVDGIRKVYGQRVVSWFGSDARFLVENL